MKKLPYNFVLFICFSLHLLVVAEIWVPPQDSLSPGAHSAMSCHWSLVWVSFPKSMRWWSCFLETHMSFCSSPSHVSFLLLSADHPVSPPHGMFNPKGALPLLSKSSHHPGGFSCSINNPSHILGSQFLSLWGPLPSFSFILGWPQSGACHQSKLFQNHNLFSLLGALWLNCPHDPLLEHTLGLQIHWFLCLLLFSHFYLAYMQYSVISNFSLLITQQLPTAMTPTWGNPKSWMNPTTLFLTCLCLIYWVFLDTVFTSWSSFLSEYMMRPSNLSVYFPISNCPTVLKIPNQGILLQLRW